MMPVALGISAHMGWASVVAITSADPLLRVLRSDRLETARRGDHGGGAPYHLAAGFVGAERRPAPRDPAAVVERGLARQRGHTQRTFAGLIGALESAGQRPTRAALLVGKGRLAASLERILASHAQIHVAEGLAVRDSIARALETLGVTVIRIPESSLLADAERELRIDQRQVERWLAAAKPELGGPWRKEQRTAALAARLALEAGHRGGREPRTIGSRPPARRG
jgi:hypothetical protein